jgi:hypothetical protein
MTLQRVVVVTGTDDVGSDDVQKDERHCLASEVDSETGDICLTFSSRLANRPKPEMKRPFKFFNSSPRKFISSVVKDKEKIDEAISNVRIDSDGDVGQVWFDYNFVRGSYKENWGKESWQVVRTSDGWKIAGVVWSQELNPTPPPSAGLR